MNLTERQKREQDYYNQFANMFSKNDEVDFSPVLGEEKRPWNSYWYTYHLLEKAASGRRDAALLDFGSGPGENALRFANLGYMVEGFDISEKNIQMSSKLFEKYNFSDRGHFKVSAAEKLDYADETFDVIAGIDILHHVDIAAAIVECHRVLKKGGLAVFREPIDVPGWDRIRESKLVTKFFPKDASFENHITADERKLNNHDLEILKNKFPNITIDKFLLLSRFDPYLRKEHDPTPSLLEKIDAFLIKYIPGMAKLGGAMVITLRK